MSPATPADHATSSTRATGRPSSSQRSKASAVLDILEATYPDAKCELDFGSVFQLLVATILSAQSTDRRVNRVTVALFSRYPDPSAMAQADCDAVEEIIHSTGFFRVKAENIIRASQMLVDDFAGVVPQTLAELIRLPGVGRKTANVVLSDGYGIPGITTDTHVLRLSRRLGWTSQTEPVKVERDLDLLFSPDRWISLSHVLIWHGRRCCHAVRPACGVCPVVELCPSFGAGETDPLKAAALIKPPRK